MIRIIEARMADLIRRTTIGRGYDPRDFVVFAFGGAGPAHAAAYAKDVGAKTVIVPSTASVFSSRGIATCDFLRIFRLLEADAKNAFAYTDLDAVLRGKKRDTIIVTGVSTNIGPETTVRDAVVRDYKVVFVSDCTANKDIPDMGWGVIPADVPKKVSFSVLAQAFCR